MEKEDIRSARIRVESARLRWMNGAKSAWETAATLLVVAEVSTIDLKASRKSREVGDDDELIVTGPKI